MSINDNSVVKILSEINYKIGKKLGEGMFSTVKLGTHSLTNEQVAIKIVEKAKISKIEDKERINREISILKKVNHYNIAKLYQVVETKLIIYLIQEYIQGKDFLEYLNKKKKLIETEACKFFHQIISGLEYLHQCGIAHRDFKPENIILTNNNQLLKIIDFGLSNTYKDGQLLKTGCGSPCYVPPEMIKEEKYNGALTDIWSAGVILYLMLCGNLPFYDDDNEILYEKILSGKYLTPDHLSEDAKDILKKILEIDPKKRINFEGIKAHPWFSLIDKRYLMHKGVNINIDIVPIDEEIIGKMESMGFNKVEIRYNILKNYHNKITTVYDLLLKKKIERGNKSIADLNSDLFDEYINDKKNKIEFYGNIEKVLKNKIGDGQKEVNNIPNYPENKYEENNDNVIIGHSGSVLERLIKSGRFTYDEENMCLNKVVNSKQKYSKDNSNDDESRFKTVSSMQTKNNKKERKITEDYKEKKNKVHFEKDDEGEEESISKSNKSPKAKKSNLKNSKREEKKIEKKEKEKEKEEDDEDEEEWYKEMVEQIEKDKRRMTTQQKSNKTKKVKILKENKTSQLHREKKKGVKIKVPPLNINKEDMDLNIETKNKALSSRMSKAKLGDKNIYKKANSKNSNNNDNITLNKYKSTKALKRVTKKPVSNLEDSYDNKNAGYLSSRANHSSKKTIRIIRKESSVDKNEKYKKKVSKFKKISDENNNEGGVKKRNLSCEKRNVRIKI